MCSTIAAKIAIRRARSARRSAGNDSQGGLTPSLWWNGWTQSDRGVRGSSAGTIPNRFHPGEPLVTDRVPALLIDRGVAVDLLLGGVEREVRGVEGEVEEPGAGWVAAVLGEEVERVVGEGVGRIELARAGRTAWAGLLGSRVVERVLLPEAVEPADHPVEVVEPPADRAGVGAEVPLAHHRRAVSGRLEDLGDRRATLGEVASVARPSGPLRRPSCRRPPPDGGTGR